MDPKDIPERLSAIGRNQAQLARHIGLDPSSLTKTIKGVRRLKADEMIALEQFLAQDPVPGSQPWSRPQMVSRYSVAEGSKIAIFGYAAAAGEDSIAMNDGGIVEWIEAPPHHNGAELFGVRVLGVSMIPRFFEGEKAIAQRLLPPARGQDVVVEFEDGSGVIKTYVNQKDGFVNCEQWNEPRPLSYSLTGAKNTRKVKALHAVLWRR